MQKFAKKFTEDSSDSSQTIIEPSGDISASVSPLPERISREKDFKKDSVSQNLSQNISKVSSDDYSDEFEIPLQKPRLSIKESDGIKFQQAQSLIKKNVMNFKIRVKGIITFLKGKLIRILSRKVKVLQK